MWPSSRPCALCRVLAVVFSSLLLSSCSWYTEFVVVNVTDQPIRIEYWLKTRSACEAELAPTVAAVTIDRQVAFGPLSDLDIKVSERWSPLPHRATGNCGSVVAEIPPQRAARIAEAFNYIHPTLEDWEDFELSRLEVSSAGGRMRLCGPALLVAFEGTRTQQLLVVIGSPKQMRLDFCEVSPDERRERTVDATAQPRSG
jgi:hypothetical protein